MHFAGQSSRRLRVWVLAVTAPVLVAGCRASSAAPGPTPPPATHAAVPASGGVMLRQLGFTHGPDFELPPGVQVVKGVDQSNVVTLVLSQPDGPALAAWMRDRAGRDGWRTTASNGDAVLFEDATWAGAFTAGNPSGLTFRRRG